MDVLVQNYQEPVPGSIRRALFFTKGDNIANINKVMRFIDDKELGRLIKTVHRLGENEQLPEKLIQEVDVPARAYPDLDVELS